MSTAEIVVHDRLAPAGLPLGGLSPVSLDELVNRAELLTRFDRKYLLPIEAAVEVVRRVDPRSLVLEIGGRRALAYDSVYFDTGDRLAYRLTAQKRRRRFKLRTRSYLDTGTSFLEVKTKDGRGNTVKQRIGCAPGDRTRLTGEGRSFIAETLSRQGHDASVVDRLEPVMVSRYRRTTLLLPCGSRTTIDTELRWFDPRGREVSLEGYAIVESKSTSGANELDRALWHAGYRPTGISKFGTGLAALHPELPRNKWARVLNTVFAGDPRGAAHGDAAATRQAGTKTKIPQIPQTPQTRPPLENEGTS